MSDLTRTVATVIVRDNKVLLVRQIVPGRHLTGMYGLPGGRVEENEKEVEAAARELKEETGLVVAPSTLIKLPREWTAGNFTLSAFIANDFSGELSGSPEGVPEWVEIGKLDDYDLRPNVKEIIQTAIEHAGTA